MVVRYLYIVGVASLVIEAKTDPQLLVDGYRSLPATITSQLVQPVTRWDRKIGDPLRVVQQSELAGRSSLQLCAELLGRATREDPFGVLVREAPYHGHILLRNDNTDKR